jgi:hypothetical protein
MVLPVVTTRTMLSTRQDKCQGKRTNTKDTTQVEKHKEDPAPLVSSKQEQRRILLEGRTLFQQRWPNVEKEKLAYQTTFYSIHLFRGLATGPKLAQQQSDRF